MSKNTKNRDFARGEAKSKIHWGADVQEVFDLLRSKYGIDGEEADVIVAEAMAARRRYVRTKASIGLGFATIGLIIAVAYFAIQGFVGFVTIGLGPILMGLLGLASVTTAGRSISRLITGDSSGPA